MIVYLASPYSHVDSAVREARFQEVARIAAKLMAHGVHLYCPITHTHPIALAALEKLTKWRAVFAGWQLGTRSKSDPESQAVRDHREVTMLLRAEVSALTGLMLKKGVFTPDEFHQQLLEEARALDAMYEGRFPGIKTDELGVVMDLQVAAETMKGWKS